MLSFSHDLSLASRNTSSEDVSSPSQRNPNNTDKTQEKKASGLVATAQILTGCIGNCEIDYMSTLYCRSINSALYSCGVQNKPPPQSRYLRRELEKSAYGPSAYPLDPSPGLVSFHWE